MPFSFYVTRQRFGANQIRGYQIAEHLGARVNPPDLENPDVCIVVKDTPTAFSPRRMVGARWMDILDSHSLMKKARTWRGGLGLLAASRTAERYLRDQCPENPVAFVPQQHCNTERETRTREAITTVGLIARGAQSTDACVQPLADGIAKMGLAFEVCGRFWGRADVQAFHRRIDIHLHWRGLLDDDLMAMKSSLRVANAGSYGIPSVGTPEPAVLEDFPGAAYVSATTYADMLEGIAALRDPARYHATARAARGCAERFHVERVALDYRALEGIPT